METSQDTPLSRWTMTELLMVPLLPFCRQRSFQAAWLTVTLFSPHRVPSAAASSLERQEPFTEHQSVWQRFWKRKETAAVWSRAELLQLRFSKASHSFVHPFTKPYKGCISKGRCSGFSTKLAPTKGPNLGTLSWCTRRDYLTNTKWWILSVKWITWTTCIQIFSSLAAQLTATHQKNGFMKFEHYWL